MTSIPCDIVLRPSSAIKDLAIKTSGELSDYGTLFTLKEGEYFPHVSLYMVQLNLDTIDNIQNALEKIARSTGPISLTAKDFHQENGYIDIEYERNQIIDDLQNTVLDAINPLRDGLRKKDEERIKTSTGVELENLQKYGYRSVGSKFAPHVTLTRFTDPGTKPTIQTAAQKFDGEFASIAVFEMGDNGTCVRQLFEIPLGQ